MALRFPVVEELPALSISRLGLCTTPSAALSHPWMLPQSQVEPTVLQSHLLDLEEARENTA
jgi:hypothetical protein